MNTVVECTRTFDKPWIGIVTLRKVGMLSRSATWAHCIFGEEVLHRITHRLLIGFGRPLRVDIRQVNRSLHGCISREPVYGRTTQSRHSGCNWPHTAGIHVHKWTWGISTSKERACCSTMSRLTCGTRWQSPEETDAQRRDSKTCQD